jgi:hypothetical protein
MTANLPNVSQRFVVVKDALDLFSEKEALLLKEKQAAVAKAKTDLEQIQKQVKAQPWLQIKVLQAKQLLKEKEQTLEKKISKADLHKKFDAVSAKYHTAMEKCNKTHGHKMVSSSVHSTSRTFRRGNVVLMAPENAEECLRQAMRAELGLQDAPLLLTAGDVCDECGVQMLVVSNDSMLSCPSCHKLRILPNTMTTSALHGTDVEVSNTITKHRLPEWMEMAQAKEFAEPPDELLIDVSNFLIKNNMTGLEEFKDIIKDERSKGPFLSVADAIDRLGDKVPNLESKLKSLNAATARIALKGLVIDGHTKYRKFYERSAKVASIVSGFWPPRMNSQQEEVLRLLYTTAAPFYEKRRKPKQTYWPGGFPFFLRSICVLLGYDEFAAQFPIPSGSKEGGSRDQLRNEIWTELGWETVPYTGKPAPMLLPNGELWSLSLDEETLDEEEEDGKKATKQLKKEVETKISIKKRRRVDFELQCA